MTSYTPDQAVPITPATSIERTVLPDGSAIFIIRDITATLPIACGTPTVIMADLWSSQSAQAQRAHCVNCGIRFGAGFVGVQGLVNCTNLTFNARITKNIPQDITGFYTIHADVNGDGYYSPMIDTIVIDTTNFSITGGAGAFVNVTGNLLQANLNQDVFIVITLTSGPAPGTTRVTLLPSGICGSLPVTFRSFTASRVDANRVTLRWETATEINNAGFTILRNNGPAWEQVMYVPSHAAGGNSTSALTYNFMDQNSHRGMTQYRIRQVDLDGKIKMSDIRAVRGEGQTTQLIVYPNPSNNGNVNVVFNDQNVTRDAILIDMSGRTIRQWQGVTSNTIQVENLLPGIYTFRSTTRETGFHDSGKIVVTK
jgi:hypothetical protein